MVVPSAEVTRAIGSPHVELSAHWWADAGVLTPVGRPGGQAFPSSLACRRVEALGPRPDVSGRVTLGLRGCWWRGGDPSGGRRRGGVGEVLAPDEPVVDRGQSGEGDEADGWIAFEARDPGDGEVG